MTHHLGPYVCREASANGGWKQVEWTQAKGMPERGKGLVAGVPECRVVWSAMSLLKIVQLYLTFAASSPAG